MSNFQVKYYYDFKSLDNRNQRVEILQDSLSAVTATKVNGSTDPFVASMPSLDGKFQPVRGTGADLNLFATQTLQYLDLYTANIQEYQVRHYIEGVLNWCGYLDTEVFESDFSRQKNYSVAMTANDGFALLERLNYLQSNGNRYQGLSTHWQVLQSIIGKLNLPYNGIWVGISTGISGQSLSEWETVFHRTYTNNQNWYNEDGDPETCRKVLEEILRPYGAYVLQDRAGLYITDVNTCATATTASFKKYDASFNYIGTEYLNLNLGDLSTIGFRSNVINLSTVGGFNKQVIRYSPYVSDLIGYSETDFTGTTGSTEYGTSPFKWTETTYSTSASWDAYNNGRFCSYVGSDSENGDETDSYLKVIRYGTNGASSGTLSFRYKRELPYIVPSSAMLRLNMKAMFRTVTDLNGIITTADIYQGKLRCRLKVGNRQYYRTSTVAYPTYYVNSGWVADTQPYTFDLDFENRVIKNNVAGFAAIDNQYVELKKSDTNGGSGNTLRLVEKDYLIPLTQSLLHGITGGDLVFEIYDFDIMVDPYASTTPNHDTIKNKVIDVRIKDFGLSIVDAQGKEFSTNDIEYVGYMNANFKNAGGEVTLLQGSGVTMNSTEKGALLGLNENGYYFLGGWIRQGRTDLIENLLLGSMVSNYTDKTIQVDAKLTRLGSHLGCLRYENYLPGKRFMLTSIRNDYANATSEVSMQEVFVDSLNINKSF